MTDRPDRRTPKPARSVALEFPPRGGGAPYLGINLTEEELAVIGRIAVQWSQLEKIIFDMTHVACALMSVEIPADTENFSFSRRFRAMQTVLRQFFANDPDALKECEKLIGRIGRNEGRRHKTVHGLWDIDTDDSRSFVVWNDRISKSNQKRLTCKN